MEERKWKVYVHENKINGKRYVGITSKKRVAARWENGKGYIANKHFNNAINKYGWDGFYHYVIAEKLTEHEAKQMEIDFIEVWDLMNCHNGYNKTKGGDGTVGRVFSEDTIIKMRNSAIGKIVSDETKEKQKEIRNTLKYDYSKGVVCLTTGKAFMSIVDANTFYNFDKSDSHISACCKGKRKYAGIDEFGYALCWCYKENYDEKVKGFIKFKPHGKNNIKIINLYDLIIYDSAKQASNTYNIDSSAITKCCKGKQKTISDKNGNKHKFMYYSDYIEQTTKQ